VITFVIFASGLKYVGVSTTILGWVLVSVLAVGFAAWLWFTHPWTKEDVAEEDRVPAALG
jgi:hypothetical protein